MNSTEVTPGQVVHLVRTHAVDEVDGALHGAAFDGRRLVLAAGDRLVRLMPDSGRFVDQFETFPARGELAYDGRHLWQHSEGQIQELDPRTGYVVRSLSPRLGEIAGLECIADDLLVLHAGGRAIARIETLDAKPVAQVEVNVPLRGLAWAARTLWSSTAGALCRVDMASGRVAQFALPAGIEVWDLAGDSKGRIWCVDGRSRHVRAFALPTA